MNVRRHTAIRTIIRVTIGLSLLGLATAAAIATRSAIRADARTSPTVNAVLAVERAVTMRTTSTRHALPRPITMVAITPTAAPPHNRYATVTVADLTRSACRNLFWALVPTQTHLVVDGRPVRPSLRMKRTMCTQPANTIVVTNAPGGHHHMLRPLLPLL